MVIRDRHRARSCVRTAYDDACRPTTSANPRPRAPRLAPEGCWRGGRCRGRRARPDQSSAAPAAARTPPRIVNSGGRKSLVLTGIPGRERRRRAVSRRGRRSRATRRTSRESCRARHAGGRCGGSRSGRRRHRRARPTDGRRTPGCRGAIAARLSPVRRDGVRKKTTQRRRGDCGPGHDSLACVGGSRARARQRPVRRKDNQ